LALWNALVHVKREKRTAPPQEKFRMKLTLIAPLAALLLVSPAALAQEGPGKACKADREKFCPDMKPGDGKLGACLKQHEAEFSPECQAARKEAQEARKNIRMSCKAETDKLCADAHKDRGGVVKCLESHASELGQPCADALKSRPGAKNS
jgi:Cysteine rich repeat